MSGDGMDILYETAFKKDMNYAIYSSYVLSWSIIELPRDDDECLDSSHMQ